MTIAREIGRELSAAEAALLRRYPGAKAGAGVYQAIINEFPPHRVYLEAFVGSGAILLRKRPAEASIVVDRDEVVAARWSTIAASGGIAGLNVINGDARAVIADLGERIHADWLIYCDPPYVRSARRSRAPIYRHELTDDDHRDLASVLMTVRARVVVSGYRCPLYDEIYRAWRRVDVPAMTRAGPAVESLWLNFAPPTVRHEYTYLGANYRERERIKRKQDRWRKRIAGMAELEREAMYQVLLEHRQGRRGRPARTTGADEASSSRAAAPPLSAMGAPVASLASPAGAGDRRSLTAGPGGIGRSGGKVLTAAPGVDQASGPERGGP